MQLPATQKGKPIFRFWNANTNVCFSATKEYLILMQKKLLWYLKILTPLGFLCCLQFFSSQLINSKLCSDQGLCALTLSFFVWLCWWRWTHCRLSQHILFVLLVPVWALCTAFTPDAVRMTLMPVLHLTYLSALLSQSSVSLSSVFEWLILGQLKGIAWHLRHFDYLALARSVHLFIYQQENTISQNVQLLMIYAHHYPWSDSGPNFKIEFQDKITHTL